MPTVTWLPTLRRAGWPVETRAVDMPARTDTARASVVPKEVSVVPESWLRELARRLGKPWHECCRGTVSR